MSDRILNLPDEVANGIVAITGGDIGNAKAKMVIQYMLWDVTNGTAYKELDDVLVENCVFRMAKYDQFIRLDIIAESATSEELNNTFKLLEDYAFSRQISEVDAEKVKNSEYLPYISGLIRNNEPDENGEIYTFAFTLPVNWQLQPLNPIDNEIRCLQISFFADNVEMVVD